MTEGSFIALSSEVRGVLVDRTHLGTVRVQLTKDLRFYLTPEDATAMRDRLTAAIKAGE